MILFELLWVPYAALLRVLWFVNQIYYGRQRTLPLPPGPFGNWLLQTRSVGYRSAFQFAKLTETYGPVFSVKQGSQRIVVIGRYKAAMDIMEKEGAFLADRPRYVSGGEVLSGDMRITFVGDADELRRFRRQGITLPSTQIFQHSHVSKIYACPFSAKGRSNPRVDAKPTRKEYAPGYARGSDSINHQMHAKRYAASVTMDFTYGKTTPTAYTDPEVIAMNHFIKRVNLALRPGASLVDSYPILKRVPYYLNELRKWHLEELASFQGLVYVVRQQLAEGETRS